uniref:Glutamine and serine rich 1 n=1 Tax=Neogobius melanostomus TaxID=47308 RepID=A0A8C6WHB4_9GOBI
MSFLSAMESRSLQAGPVSASLLPPFRPPSWPPGTNASTTELYLTGALPSTATFPSTAALMSYPHTSAYPTRSYATNSPPALQDPVFSTSTNGLFPSHHDPLLHLKPNQTMLPTALAFSTPIGSTLPVQSSTYRSAQESAPHLLQPQFSLLPCPLSTSHGPTQQYGATVFSGSIERALQRECSVIKHHQRPSTNSTATEQSSDSEPSLQSYFGSVSEGEVTYPHEQSPVSCNLTSGSDSTQGVVTQAKTVSVSEAYSAISVPKAKDNHLNDLDKDSDYNNHRSPGQKQNSVIANQQCTQLPAPLSCNSQIYISSHTQSQAPCSSADKLPSPSRQSGNISSINNQSHDYSPGQEQEVQYTAQSQGLCQGLALSEGYPTPHSQGTSLLTYTSQSEVHSTLPYAHSYAPGQSLHSTFPTTSMQSIPTSNSPQQYSLIQASGEKVLDTLSQQEAQDNKFAPLPIYSASLQALPNNRRTSVEDIKPSGLMQTVSLCATVPDSSLSAPNIIYVVSKMEDHLKSQSVIRSRSRSNDHANGLAPLTASISAIGSSVVGSPAQLNLEQKLLSAQIKSSESHLQSHNHYQSHVTAGHTQFITVPSNQVLVEPNQMIVLQQPLLQHSQDSSKVALVSGMQQPQGLGPVHVQYLQMDRNLLGSTMPATTNQQGQFPEENSRCPNSKHPLTSEGHYDQPTNQHMNDAKNHFALNSICFSDAVLDERNILSNVDDILAATVAACGVHDFVKASSSAEAEMTKVNSTDPKNQFHTIDMRHMGPIFSSAQELTRATTSTVAMVSNGLQMTSGCKEHSSNFNHKSEHICASSQSEHTSEHHRNGDKERSESTFKYEPSYNESQTKGRAILCMKTEEGSVECTDGEIKKKRKSLTKAGVDEDVLLKTAKRSGQAKRQNSKASDTPPPVATNTTDSCPQQERIRQKIREVEEKQPDVKNGFIGSFLDFLKSGPKQQYSPSPARTVSRSKKPCTPPKPPASILPNLPSQVQTPTVPLLPQESTVVNSQPKRLDEDLQRNLETLPSFSSDEEENTGKNQALRNSISSVLSSLDESSERKLRIGNLFYILTTVSTPMLKETPVVIGEKSFLATPSQAAVQLPSVALEGLTDDELSDSGGEGMYRERDEFVVRNEDVESVKVLLTMKAGSEPPAIWKVQKALLQKFVPELRDGQSIFSHKQCKYLGYFGDAKSMYRRVYVKFLDTVNKREYVRVCSRKPRCKPMTSLRGVQVKTILGLTANTCTTTFSQKPRPKSKPRVEPPPKKRRKWKEEFSSTHSDSSAEEDELSPPVPFTSRLLNTRTMKETFKGFVELLISIALDEDLMSALEKSNDELLLPHMKRVDGMITDNRKRLLHKLPIENVLKTALDSFPEIAVVTELKKDGDTPAFKVRLSGRAYNKKTMKPYKMPNKVPQEYTVDQQKTQWFSLYHSLQHYKYHTYLMCKNEIESLRVQAGEMGQEETVQKCLQNGAWLEGLFDRFGELINQVQQAS